MNGRRGGSSSGGIVIVIFLGWADWEEGGVLVVGWWVVLWSEAFAEQG